MVCSACQAENPDTARFCNGCGTALLGTAATGDTVSGQTAITGETASPRMKAALAITISAVLIWVGLAWWATVSHQKEEAAKQLEQKKLDEESDKKVAQEMAVIRRKLDLIMQGKDPSAAEAQAEAEGKAGTIDENRLKEAYVKQGHSKESAAALVTDRKGVLELGRLRGQNVSPSVGEDLTFCLVRSRRIQGTTEDDSTTITGTILNACNTDFRYVEITFDLLDVSGAVVGKAMANVAGLATGQTWRFRAIGLYRCKRIQFEKIQAS